MKAKWNWFCDWLWVMQAYFRGKVLRQKAYRPNGNIFPTMGVSTRRLIGLINAWGMRPATMNELTTILAASRGEKWPTEPGRTLALRWDSEQKKWELTGKKEWDDSRVIFTRK